MFLDLVEQFSVLGGIDPNHLGRATQGDQGLIGTDVRGQDAIGLFADLNDPFPGLHIPNDNAAKGRSLSAAGHQ